MFEYVKRQIDIKYNPIGTISIFKALLIANVKHFEGLFKTVRFELENTGSSLKSCTKTRGSKRMENNVTINTNTIRLKTEAAELIALNSKWNEKSWIIISAHLFKS